MKKKFSIVDSSRYYIPPKIAKAAVGYDSMGSYIASLQAIKELSEESVNSRINEIHFANAKILEEVSKLQSFVGKNKIDSISKALEGLQFEVWGRDWVTKEESDQASAALWEFGSSFDKLQKILKAQEKK